MIEIQTAMCRMSDTSPFLGYMDGFVGYTHRGYKCNTRKRSQGLLPGYELGVAGGAIGVDFGADNHCARGGSEDGAA